MWWSKHRVAVYYSPVTCREQARLDITKLDTPRGARSFELRLLSGEWPEMKLLASWLTHSKVADFYVEYLAEDRIHIEVLLS